MTVGISLIWAAFTPALMAVNCPDPSAATVMAFLGPRTDCELAAEDVTAPMGLEKVDVVGTGTDADATEEAELELADETVSPADRLCEAAHPKRLIQIEDRILHRFLFQRQVISRVNRESETPAFRPG